MRSRWLCTIGQVRAFWVLNIWFRVGFWVVILWFWLHSWLNWFVILLVLTLVVWGEIGFFVVFGLHKLWFMVLLFDLIFLLGWFCVWGLVLLLFYFGFGFDGFSYFGFWCFGTILVFWRLRNVVVSIWWGFCGIWYFREFVLLWNGFLEFNCFCSLNGFCLFDSGICLIWVFSGFVYLLELWWFWWF